VPSNVESALFGTKIADDFVPVHTGGDVALLNGVLKVLLAQGAVDRDFIDQHTAGFEGLVAALDGQDMDDLIERSGASRDDMERFARHCADAKRAVLVWSMGITQHEHGSDNVAAIVNLALARGWLGQPGAGLMPIRGHSGVQGGAEMGAYATSFPGGKPIDEQTAAELSTVYGFPVPATPVLSAEEMILAAERGELDVLWSSGGNFLEVMPDPARVEAALSRVPLRVHQDIVLSSQMLVDGDAVLLLPAATRYEQHGGGTETTTERRIAFSPEIRGPRPGEARSEWEIFAEVGARVAPDRAHLIEFESGDAIRSEIARVVPSYAGVDELRQTGDAVQWGGPMLCADGVFPTDDGRGHFTPVTPPTMNANGRLRLSTRRGKQFNTMVQEQHDSITGADRDAVLLAATDAERLGLQSGVSVMVRSDHGELRGRVQIAPIAAGNVQVMFPEGNVLLPFGPRDPASGVPDYTTLVDVVSEA
jgi:molybdopterin-dependent oxidoreductase alpha subunit